MLLLLLLDLGRAAPADLAPGAPEFQEQQQRLENLLRTNAAVATAVGRLQERWALPPTPPEKPPPAGDPSRGVLPVTRVVPVPDPCADAERLALGWRLEHFGAAWRETAQATRVAAERLAALRHAPTIAPLVDERWSAEVDALVARADRALRGYHEGSAWQARFVRPALSGCPRVEVAAAPGYVSLEVRAVGEASPPVAVLALGDGWVCPGARRADGAIVLLDGDRACFSATSSCACDPEPVAPGAVLGPP